MFTFLWISRLSAEVLATFSPAFGLLNLDITTATLFFYKLFVRSHDWLSKTRSSFLTGVVGAISRGPSRSPFLVQ